jgi:hypothetical protein
MYLSVAHCQGGGRLIDQYVAIQSVYNSDLPHTQSAATRSREMSKNETREILSKDIDSFRLKAKYYESLRLHEAANYAKKLASNIELALTTMPSDDDPEIS